MVLAHMSPEWFYGFDAALELLFAITCTMVVLFSYQIYTKTGVRTIKYFGLSFLMITISYLIQSFFNYKIITEFAQNNHPAITIHSIGLFQTAGILAHMLFMTTGLSILLYTTLKDKRQITLWLILTISLSTVIFSTNNLMMFYIIATIFLTFISWNYIMNYLHNRKPRTLLVALAFLFLLFGNFHFLISVNHQLFYPIGHILELFAYIFILLNLYLVRKR